ncbi:MAG: hypothetical protein MUF74_04620 [Cypionkella sp.]|nr:hypothetical protein [Cypionkella sp.]
MTPSFALDLTEEGVTLLHRTGQGWMELGRAAFSDPDLPAALDYLRRTATGLSPKGMTTKLVIPNSQILYTEVNAPGPSEAERRAQIEAALEGRTPYDVADLVYDWTGDGPVVRVAVVARETLGEAEAFATEHRFNPVAFVATPESGFADEVFFGQTTVAPSILPKSAKVERDHGLMQVVVRDLPREPVTGPETLSGPDASSEPEPLPEPERAEPVPQGGQPEPEAVPQSAPSEAVMPPPEPELPLDTATLVEPPVAKPDEQPDISTAVTPPIVTEANDAPAAADDQAQEPVFAPVETRSENAPHIPKVTAPPPVTPTVAEEAPMAVDVPQDEDDTASLQSGKARVTDPSAPKDDDDVPPQPSAAALMAFASRRSGDLPPPPRKPALTAGGEAPQGKAPTVARPAMAKPLAERPVTAPKPVVERPAPTRTPKFSYDDPLPAPPRMPGDPPIAPATLAAAAKAAKGLKSSLGSLVTAPSIPAAKPKKPAPPKLAPSVTPSEATAATVSPDALAKGLSARTMAQRGKPKHLGSVDAAPETTAEPPSDPLPAIADGQAIGPAQSGQPQSAASDQDEIFLAGMERPPVLNDPLALAAPQAGPDTLPAPQMPPPPFGTVYRFDSEGRIIPTAEGIASPDGVLLVAGQPPRVPPQRPAEVEAAAAAAATPPSPEDAGNTEQPAPADAAPASASAVDGVVPAETFGADPSLAQSRPRIKPEGLVIPAAPAGGEDDASLAPAEDSRFSSLRPRLRPQAILAAGEASRQAAEAASLAAQAAAQAAADAAVAEAAADVSPMAVSVSRIPAPRPRDLNRAVEAAVAAATQPAARAAPAASPQAERTEEEEEELDAVEVSSAAAPNIPTRADVARQATFVNAINLSRLNLIGVYGSNADRHALVRQANGRYVKVKVGDRLDGGTVRAITASEVRYQKGGRMIALAMPQG